MNDMESVEEYDPEYREISSSLSETYYVLEDISKRLEAIIEDLDFDGNRLMQVENRLDLLHTITRKYGGTVDDVLLYFAKITEEYNLLTGNNLSSEDMEAELRSWKSILSIWQVNLLLLVIIWLSNSKLRLNKNCKIFIWKKPSFRFVLVRENSVVREIKWLSFIFQPTLEKTLNPWLRLLLEGIISSHVSH